jgi:hypothetical protein
MSKFDKVIEEINGSSSDKEFWLGTIKDFLRKAGMVKSTEDPNVFLTEHYKATFIENVDYHIIKGDPFELVVEPLDDKPSVNEWSERRIIFWFDLNKVGDDLYAGYTAHGDRRESMDKTKFTGEAGDTTFNAPRTEDTIVNINFAPFLSHFIQDDYADHIK